MFPQNYMHNVDSDRMKMNEVYKWLIDVPYKTSETGSRAHHTHTAIDTIRKKGDGNRKKRPRAVLAIDTILAVHKI